MGNRQLAKLKLQITNRTSKNQTYYEFGAKNNGRNERCHEK